MKRLLLILLACAPALPAMADTRETVEEGRKLFGQEEYAEAHDKFFEAAADLPGSPLLSFNQAGTFYKRQDYDKAIELYQQGLQTKDLQLEAAGKYNLGNCYFQQAVKSQTDLGKAIELLDRAMLYYRDAMDTLADPTQARYNLEKSKMLKKDLLDKKKKEMEDQQKNQQKDQNQDQQQDQQQQQDGDGEDQQDQQQQQGSDEQEKEEEQKPEQAQQEETRQLSPEEAEKLLNAIREKQKESERDERTRKPARYMKIPRDW